MRTKGLASANMLMDIVRLKVEQDPQMQKKVLEILRHQDVLCSVVEAMHPDEEDEGTANRVSREEEISLLKTSVTPLCLDKHIPQKKRDKPYYTYPCSKSFLVLQDFYQKIVHIIDTKNMVTSFANSLCEARLVPLVVRDEVEKIDNRLIQAKAIMGEVLIIVQRAVIPDKLMKAFISVLKKFHSHFEAIINELEREGFSLAISSDHEDHSQIKAITNVTMSAGSELPPLRPLTCETDFPSDDPYRRVLYLNHNHRPEMVCSSPKGWKFFDLASIEVTEQSASEKTLDLHCLPHSNVYPPRTLIFGGPGVGKSSIVIELCKRWVNGDLLQEFNYVIHLRAFEPDVNNAKCLNDIIPEEYQSQVCLANGKKSLFIIDGYDELNEESRFHTSFFNCLIKGKLHRLCEAAVIVTTRPWCAKSIAKHFPNQVEILGFTPQGKDTYIQYMLEKDADDFLQQCTSVERCLCLSIPFYLATLMKIFKECTQKQQPIASFPKTVTKLYGALIRTLVLQFVENHDDLEELLPEVFEIDPGEFFVFPRQIYLPLFDLCILSYKSLSDEASLVPKRGSVTFDLLNGQTKETTSGRKGCYKFLHSSIKEYLAAYCISRMESNEKKKCIQNLKQSKKFSLVLEFLHGFGCIQSIDAEECETYRFVNNFDVFRQLCEADSSELIKSVYENIPMREDNEQVCSVRRTFPTPSPADFWCFGRVIAISNCDWYLGFTLRNIQNDHLEMLYKGIQSAGSAHEPMGRIRRLALSLTNIDQNGLCHVFKINKACLSSLCDIQLKKNCLTADAVPLLCESLPQLPKLRRFFFDHSKVPATGGHNEKLILALSKCEALDHVTFSDLLPSECQLLLTHLKHLKIVEFWHISTESCEASFDCLPDSSIEQLQIYRSHIDFKCVKSLPTKLPASRIRHLKLINCGINCETVEVIVAGAAHTKGLQLQTINLSDNCISERGGKELLWLCQKLKHLDPSESYKFNDFSPDVYEGLKKMKKDNTCNFCNSDHNNN